MKFQFFDVPAAIYGARLQTYIKKAKKIIVPVLPSPIDMSAARDFLNSIRGLGSVIRNRTDICLVANRCRANTNIFEELDDYLVREKGIRYVTAFRDNTNYINAAKKELEFLKCGRINDHRRQRRMEAFIVLAKFKEEEIVNYLNYLQYPV